MQGIEAYKTEFLNYLNARINIRDPENLYEPILYILGIGGKRLRPILTLLTCDLFDGNRAKAFDAALAVEMFHNFTLIHDDIMDKASLRRGNATVHERWDINTGILSGDAMMILANQCLESYEPFIFKKLFVLFNKTALEVCEGQQMDMDFETSNTVDLPLYMTMIQNKTSVLVACAMKMGAILAEATDEEANTIYDFGLNLGLAFQLQDDYLDSFGDADVFGKRIGGDILENKKTYLYLKTMEEATDEDRNTLFEFYNEKKEASNKVAEVTLLFKKYDIQKRTLTAIQDYTRKAFLCLEKLQISEVKKDYLRRFGTDLMKRTL